MSEIKLPDYNHSILNLITSILKYYKVETNHKSLETLDKQLTKKYKNVVFIVLDGMGENILNQLSPDGYFKTKQIDCITSVYPSTTTAALTTYYSGKPPYETGWIAWSQYFKEYGRALDMLHHKESYKGESIQGAKINVFDDIVNYTPIFEQIEKASPNVKAYELMPSYSDKRSKRSIRTESIDEIIENIEMLCANPDEKFILAYSDNPDGLLHKFGTISTDAKQFIEQTESKIKEMYGKLDDDTIVIISADHGHKDIDKAYSILDYPEIQECLIIPASLESRALAFWVKEDMKKEFEERFRNAFGDEFLLMNKDKFLEKHLLGYGQKHPKIDDFIGNYIALSTCGSMIRLETYFADGKPIKKSTHCGLTREEMEVPLIIL
ncbi:MAG: alkaline phosphatase family protein [Clostridia bacterium]|nr:alkaline phosphatase family protein [Clostridia bacterium]